MSPPSSTTYMPVVDSDSEKGELDTFLEESSSYENTDYRHWLRPRWARPQVLATVIPWILTGFFGILTLLLLIERDNATKPFGSYELGFDTDIVTSSRIPLERVRFRGSPHFTKNGTGYLDSPNEAAPWPENMVLFGSPSAEIDANWKKLIGQRYFAVSEDEAERAWGERRNEYVDERQGGYTAGLDLFHTLHCVNAIRKALHPEYYRPTPMHGQFHAEHCLDAIRQVVQCYGSTTLIPTKFREGLHHNYIDSDQVHTCRSFTFLRDFATSRANRHTGYVGRDQSLVDTKKHGVAQEWWAARTRNRHGH